MAGSLAPVRGDFKVWDGTVVGYITVCRGGRGIERVGVVEVRGKATRIATGRKPSRESRRESSVDIRHLVSASCSVLVRVRGQSDGDQFPFSSLQLPPASSFRIDKTHRDPAQQSLSMCEPLSALWKQILPSFSLIEGEFPSIIPKKWILRSKIRFDRLEGCPRCHFRSIVSWSP